MTSNTPPTKKGDLDALIGMRLAGRYDLQRQVGSGATTAIFEAVDTHTDRVVTFKLIRPRLAAVAEFRTGFDDAMRAAAELRHKHIAAVYDWGYADVADTRSAYLVSERLTGGSLRDMLDRGRLLSPSQALAVGLDACKALDFAHRRGMVHTELTPAKLVFGDDRRLRIVDFGLSRLIGSLMWLDPSNVPNHVAWYASPEQATGREINGGTDVYSLSLVLTESITGELPFKDGSTTATLDNRIGKLLPVNADMGPLASVLEHGARPEPADRLSAAGLGKNLVETAKRLPSPEPLPLLSSGLFETPADRMRTPSDPTGGITRAAAAGAAAAAASGHEPDVVESGRDEHAGRSASELERGYDDVDVDDGGHDLTTAGARGFDLSEETEHELRERDQPIAAPRSDYDETTVDDGNPEGRFELLMADNGDADERVEDAVASVGTAAVVDAELGRTAHDAPDDGFDLAAAPMDRTDAFVRADGHDAAEPTRDDVGAHDDDSTQHHDADANLGSTAEHASVVEPNDDVARFRRHDDASDEDPDGRPDQDGRDGRDDQARDGHVVEVSDTESSTLSFDDPDSLSASGVDSSSSHRSGSNYDPDSTGVVPVVGADSAVDTAGVVSAAGSEYDPDSTGVVPVVGADSVVDTAGVVSAAGSEYDPDSTGVVPVVGADTVSTGVVPVIDGAPGGGGVPPHQYGYDADGYQPEHDRKRRFPIKTVLGLLVIVGLAVVAVFAFKLLSTTRYLVPDLTDVPVEQAQERIAPYGWKVTVSNERSDKVPTPGRVIRTSPPAGEEVAKGEPFELVVSEGPVQRELPDLTGKTGAEAQSALRELGMIVTVERANDEKVALDKVVRWYVPDRPEVVPGSLVDPGTSIVLVVSDGPEKRTVPNLIGKPLEQARASLSELQLGLKVDAEQYDANVPAGAIAAQSEKPGVTVDRDTEIRVIVSLGSKDIEFPDLSGVDGYEAKKKALEDVGFTVELTLGDASGNDVRYFIDGKVPKPGDVYPVGTKVEFNVL